jgi:hypothetical protein
MKRIKILIGVFALIALVTSPLSAQEYGLKWTRSANHITTKTTTTPVSATVVLHTIVVNVSGAGTSWTLSIQNKETTAKVVYAATVTTGTTVIALPVGIVMTSGIDIVTAGSTAGTMDVFLTYH